MDESLWALLFVGAVFALVFGYRHVVEAVWKEKLGIKDGSEDR